MENKTVYEQVTNSEKKLLGTKRYNNSLSDNIVFRKVLTNNSSGKYENMANLYRDIFSFNWDDEKITKLKYSPRKNLF